MLDVLYCDGRLIAVHKPSGMLVHPTSWCPGEPGCLQILQDQIKAFLFPVHRLDRSTSGVLLFALDQEMASRVGALFREGKISKRYLAVVRGFTEAQGRFNEPLKRKDKCGERHALTEYEREAQVELHVPVGPYRTARYSLVRAIPHTGRNHQIRRHFAHASHPVIGDQKHGDRDHNRFFRSAFGIERLLLFATEIAFEHPTLQRRMTIRAPLPPEIQFLFKRMGWPTPSEPQSGRLRCLPIRDGSRPTALATHPAL